VHGEEPVQAVYIGGALVLGGIALTTLRRSAAPGAAGPDPAPVTAP
jgi:hypothetical protein